MTTQQIEATYPASFQKEISKTLGNHLKNRHLVNLIGMRRVGISNFLRFFLNHPQVIKTYISQKGNHLIIPVDLNDLVERELFPFWMLTLKRIADSTEQSKLPEQVRSQIQNIFLDCIQSEDLFLLIDGVRRSIVSMVEANFLPTIFFIRFDRMQDVATPQFFANLEGLQEAANHRLTYVFTTYRKLDVLFPEVFPKASVALVTQNLYLQPANIKDLEIVYSAYNNRYRLTLPKKVKNKLLELTGGYIQYLQLAMIGLNENDHLPQDEIDLFEKLISDDRIVLQSEELWESLSEVEQAVLIKLVGGEKLTGKDTDTGKYLWETGLIDENNKKLRIFSLIFEHFIKEVIQKNTPGNGIIDLSRKEFLLFNFLKTNLDQVCEREDIIAKVWPEEESFGVSDWAIDRLVSRLRGKLKQQEESFEIVTVKTRGFKLTGSS